MRNKGRSLDPRQMTSRFASTCYTCKKPIKKGEEIIYWPNGNHAEHFACGEADYRHSLASFQDEENYNNQYPSWWLKAVPGSELPEPGLFFLFVPHWKNAFSLLMHRQRNSLAKRKPDENGVLLNKSYQKPTHITQIFCKGNLMKISCH